MRKFYVETYSPFSGISWIEVRATSISTALDAAEHKLRKTTMQVGRIERARKGGPSWCKPSWV
jgi:hypothetical protein